jgi:S-DNA-T family DNA segregation ATPase FtsK/SpoIIIE
VLVVDALSTVRAALASIERADDGARLDRVLQEGPAAGISVCATTDGTSVGTVSAIAGERWVFHLDDASTARAVGVRAEPAPAVPGRLVLVDTQLAAQVVCDPVVLDELKRHEATVSRCGGPEPIGTLPVVVDPTELGPASLVPGATSIVVGLDALGLGPAVLEVPVGDHVLVAGGARTGASTALRQVAASWRDAHPGGAVLAIDRTAVVADVLAGATVVDADDARVLVVVDDADRVDDPTGELAAIAAGRRPGVTLAAAARLEAVRVAYGHWLREVARSRCGLILTSTGEVDGELLGATLPRRTIIEPRPGLGWLIDRHGHRLVQVAARMPS